jgi:hypothetical protein
MNDAHMLQKLLESDRLELIERLFLINLDLSKEVKVEDRQKLIEMYEKYYKYGVEE